MGKKPAVPVFFWKIVQYLTLLSVKGIHASVKDIIKARSCWLQIWEMKDLPFLSLRTKDEFIKFEIVVYEDEINVVFDGNAHLDSHPFTEHVHDCD